MAMLVSGSVSLLILKAYFDPMMQRIGKQSHAEVHLCGETLDLACEDLLGRVKVKIAQALRSLT